MSHVEEAEQFVLVDAGTSLEARKFVELQSFAADLVEASHALELALESYQVASPLEDARRHLVASAAMAYSRVFTHSKVRGKLTEYVEVPGEFAEVHDQMRAYRNATVAHSQSELAITYAVGVFEGASLKARSVVGASVLVPVPQELLVRFRTLIDLLLDRLDEVIAPVAQELCQELEAQQGDLQDSHVPEVRGKRSEEFTARTKRTAQPRGHTVYWEPPT